MTNLQAPTVIQSIITDPTGKYSYRAVIEDGKLGHILRVEQLLNGSWRATPGHWYISTLTEKAVPARDVIAIDYGQNWNVGGVFAAAHRWADYAKAYGIES